MDRASSVGNMKANKLHESICTDLLACHLQQVHGPLVVIDGIVHVHVQLMKTKKSFMD